MRWCFVGACSWCERRKIGGNETMKRLENGLEKVAWQERKKVGRERRGLYRKRWFESAGGC